MAPVGTGTEPEPAGLVADETASRGRGKQPVDDVIGDLGGGAEVEAGVLRVAVQLHRPLHRRQLRGELDQLAARLEGLAPQLVKAPPDEGAISWLGHELSNLFVIRRETTPSPEPQQRLERARLFLESGRVEPAIAEVHHLPNAKRAAGWIADAQRYNQARNALDLLETTAILDPHDLRDASGKQVVQPSPAAQATLNP